MRRLFPCLLALTLAATGMAAEERWEKDGLRFERAKDEQGWILTEIDRSRNYTTIDLRAEALDGRQVVALSDERRDIKLGEDEEAFYLFEKVSVKRLVLPGTIKAIQTQSFEGVDGLETLVFPDGVPTFHEEKGWFFYKDSWRSKLQTVIFEGEVAPGKLNSVLSGVPIIRFGANARFGEALRDPDFAEAKTLLAKAGSLTRLSVPYSLAIDLGIPWQTIIAHSPLKGQEVYSEPSVNEPGKARAFEMAVPGYDQGENAVCLLSCAEDGEISDVVTDIRLDALRGAEEERIYLPTLFRRFVDKQVGGAYHGRLWLKRDTVQFVPDITQRIASNRKSERLFPTVFAAATLTVTSPYAGLRVTGRSIKGRNLGQTYASDETPDRMGLAYEATLRLPMDETFAVGALIRLPTEEEIPVSIDHGRAAPTQELTIQTPAQTPWLGEAIALFLALIGILWAIVAFAYWVPGFGFVKRFVAEPFLAADWERHLLFVLSVALLALSVCGLPKSLVQVYVWTPVLQYVNASFVSSLVISITTTLVQIALGLLKGISIQPFGVGVTLEHVIEPCTDLLARVSWVGWLSTGVLAFLRAIGEILREFGTELWTFLGLSAVVCTLPGAWGRIRARCPAWLGATVSALALLTLGLPIFLACCAWLSTQLTIHAGNLFNDALASFKALAETFTFKAFLSLDALQALAGLLTDAMTELTSSAITYVMTKVFDCFVMPLGLLWLTLRQLRKFGAAKTVDFATFWERDRFVERFVPAEIRETRRRWKEAKALADERREAELALQAGADGAPIAPDPAHSAP